MWSPELEPPWAVGLELGPELEPPWTVGLELGTGLQCRGHSCKLEGLERHFQPLPQSPARAARTELGCLRHLVPADARQCHRLGVDFSTKGPVLLSVAVVSFLPLQACTFRFKFCIGKRVDF